MVVLAVAVSWQVEVLGAKCKIYLLALQDMSGKIWHTATAIGNDCTTIYPPRLTSCYPGMTYWKRVIRGNESESGGDPTRIYTLLFVQEMISKFCSSQGCQSRLPFVLHSRKVSFHIVAADPLLGAVPCWTGT